MTFSQMYNEIALNRFNSSTSKIASIKLWLNAAEIAFWNSADWTFKRMPPTSLTVTAGSNTPTMPTDFGNVIGLYDYLGDPVIYYPPAEFERRNEGDIVNAVQGEPAEYTVINGQVYLAPIPISSRTYKMPYRRRYAHLSGAPAIVAGLMSADTDTPLWDVEHHYILVPWAILIGSKFENDLFGDSLIPTRDELLAAAKEDMVGDESGEILTWGNSMAPSYW